MDREAWSAAVRGVTKSQTWLSDWAELNWWTSMCFYLFKLVFSFSSDKYPGVELLCHMVVLILNFWETFILFSIMVASIYTPTSSPPGFPFCRIFPNTCYLFSFWEKSFWQVWGNISLYYWIAFPCWLVMLNIFSCVCWPSICLLGKMSIQVLYPFFVWVLFIFWYWVVLVLYIFWISNPYQIYHL